MRNLGIKASAQNSAGGGALYTGPLDLVPGAKVGYSLARALSAAWIGQNVVKLRRDSDDATLDFVAGVDGSVDVSAVTTWLAGANGFVHTIYDQSGNGSNLVQATSSKQPAWAAALNNARPSAVFSAATSLMATAGSINFTSPGVTSFLVYSKTPGNTGSISGEGWATSSGGMIVSSAGTGGINVNYGDDATGSGTNWNSPAGIAELNDGSVAVVDYLFDCDAAPSSEEVLIVNGVNKATNASGTGAFAGLDWPLALGNNDSTRSSGSYAGQIFEWVMWESVVSGANRTLVRANDGTYYTITLS